MSDNTIISNETARRIVNDVKDIYKNKEEFKKNGIFYFHSEENILKGYALIIGPADTPYEYGYYLFEFIFPNNYPYSPPTVVFHTKDGITRFNPNLYINGKVCISILNTWRGEQWTSCQTIRSILFSLLSLFNDKPLLNEPGIKENHKDLDKYNKIISFKNFEIAIYNNLINKNFNKEFLIFNKIMIEFYKNNYKNIINKIKNLSNNKEELINTNVYNMSIKINYNNLLDKFSKYNSKECFEN